MLVCIMLLTIFTPTFNRAYCLQSLYESLKKQTCKDFEWLIVDDGSSDNTEELVKTWLNEAAFSVHYLKQPNGGKHRAVNLGVQVAKGELFFIVDSDDQLVPNAIERVLFHYNSIKEDVSFAGICGLKAFFDGARVGGENDFGILDCNSLELRYKFNIKGDMAEVIRTTIMKEYPFPEIAGEFFCPEAVVWNRIALKYKIRYFYEKIYLCDYLQDGLTSRITKIRMDSPVCITICYSELVSCDIPFLQRIKASVNYWRFYFCPSRMKKPKIAPFGLLTLPMGIIMHCHDRISLRIHGQFQGRL